MFQSLKELIKKTGIIQSLFYLIDRPFNFNLPIGKKYLAGSDLYVWINHENLETIFRPSNLLRHLSCDKALEIVICIWDEHGSLLTRQTATISPEERLNEISLRCILDAEGVVSEFGTFSIFFFSHYMDDNEPLLVNRSYVEYRNPKARGIRSLCHADQLSVALRRDGSVKPLGLRLLFPVPFTSGFAKFKDETVIVYLTNHSNQTLEVRVSGEPIIIPTLGVVRHQVMGSDAIVVMSKLSLLRPKIFVKFENEAFEVLHG